MPTIITQIKYKEDPVITGSKNIMHVAQKAKLSSSKRNGLSTLSFFMTLYAIIKALPYFFSFALFSIKIFWSKFSGYRENLFDIVSFLEKIFVPKKGTQAP